MRITNFKDREVFDFILNSNLRNLKEVLGYGSVENIRQKWNFREKLDLSSQRVTHDEVKVLVSRLTIPQLKSLDLSRNNTINDQALEILSKGDWPSLETLNLELTSVTERGLFHLLLKANWPNLQKVISNQDFWKGLLQKNWPLVEQFYQSFWKIGLNEIKLIVEKPNWPQLKHLDLSSNEDMNDAALESLSQGNWPLLEKLYFQRTKITAVGIEAIVNRSNWPQLKHLNLSENDGMNDEALEALSRANWPLLKTLGLLKTKISEEKLFWFIFNHNWLNPKQIEFTWSYDLRTLVEKLYPQYWHQLEKLDLSSKKITHHQIELIVNKCQLPQLKHLDLSANREANDEGFQILSQGNWPLLEKLYLESTKITAVGIEAIVNRSNWPQLKHLNLSYNDGINDEALEILSRGNWPLLEKLDLRDAKITRKALPNFLLNTNWPNFKTIELPYSWNVDDENLALCLIQKDLSRVERLELNNSNMTFADIERIIPQYKCPKLKHLNLSNNIYCEEISRFSLKESPEIEELYLENTRIGPEEIKAVVNGSKLSLLKQFHVSNNEIFDEGLSALAFAEWPLLEELHLKNTKITPQGIEILVNNVHFPNLKKLDISENAIFDEGLKTLISGNWPLFEHLIYSDTKVTPQGTVTLLENFKWPNFHQLEHSLNESFFNDSETSPPEIVITAIPFYYKGESIFATVLNTTWFDSKEIFLSINHFGENLLLQPRDRLDQFEKTPLSLNVLSIIKFTQHLVWPPNPKTLALSGNHLLDPEIISQGLQILVDKLDSPNLKALIASEGVLRNEGLEILASANWPLLEELFLVNSEITAQGFEALVSKSNWPHLKKLYLLRNSIQNEGLEILASAKWPLLEYLHFRETNISVQGLEAFVNKSNWPNLKKLNLSYNSLRNEGIEVLASAKWPLLESLNLHDTNISVPGLEALVKSSDWPNLKRLNVSSNEIEDQGIEILACANWPQLERLNTFPPVY